jgi:hypothetical protein
MLKLHNRKRAHRHRHYNMGVSKKTAIDCGCSIP